MDASWISWPRLSRSLPDKEDYVFGTWLAMRVAGYSSSMAASISRMVNHSFFRATRTASPLEETTILG